MAAALTKTALMIVVLTDDRFASESFCVQQAETGTGMS